LKQLRLRYIADIDLTSKLDGDSNSSFLIELGDERTLLRKYSYQIFNFLEEVSVPFEDVLSPPKGPASTRFPT